MVAPGGHAWLLQGEVVAPRGVHGCSGGCMVAPGGHVWLLSGGVGAGVVAPGGACMVAPRGACMVAPGGACRVAPGGGACMGYDEIWRYDQLAGGTHPTGMHSCFLIKNVNDIPTGAS